MDEDYSRKRPFTPERKFSIHTEVRVADVTIDDVMEYTPPIGGRPGVAIENKRGHKDAATAARQKAHTPSET